MVKRRPGVDTIVARNVLRGLQRETAGEDAEPTNHGALVRSQQTMTPFQRRAQRLVPAKHDA